MNITQQQSDWNVLEGTPSIDNLPPWTEGLKSLAVKTSRQIGKMAKALSALNPRRRHVSSLRVSWAGVLRSDCDRLIPEPSEEVRFQVANEMFLCEEGKSLVFDESWNQDAWGHVNGYRVVFLTDSSPRLKKPLRQRLQQFVMQLVRL